MYDSTLNHLNRRAKASGIDPGKLQLQLSSVPTSVSKWVIEVVYNGKDDEIVYLGDTIYEVNVADWIAENVCTEATIEGQIDSEPHRWSVKLYRANSDELLYELNEDNFGPMTCSCGELVTGHDGLCTEHRRFLNEMKKKTGWTEVKA